MRHLRGLGLAVVLVGTLGAGCGQRNADDDPSEREPKVEFQNESTRLGDGRIEAVPVPGSASTSLGDHQGAYGYTVLVPAGQTVEVCVSASGGAVGIIYYPQYSPGFQFTDTQPGCTRLLNLDAALDNTALTVVDGPTTATVQISTLLVI